MMGFDGYGASPWMWILGSLVMILFGGGLIVLVVWAIRAVGGPRAGSSDNALEVLKAGILEAIGNTPIVELRRIRPSRGARVMIKLESAIPTGSMKDRIALAMVSKAAADGRLPPRGRVVEYTGGSTGMALAFVCAASGYRCTLVSSDAFSEEKRTGMSALGAEVVIVPSDRKRITEELAREMIATAQRLAKAPDTFPTVSSDTVRTVESAGRSGRGR